MKELSIEEKAKAYDEAIKRAKGAHNSAKSDKENGVTDKITEYTIQLTETIFPELAESEHERIRKALIEFFELQDDNTTYSFVPKKDILTYLEKQGEQKPTWSEDDETGWTNTMIMIKECASFHYTRKSVKLVIDWLESIKERIGG